MGKCGYVVSLAKDIKEFITYNDNWLSADSIIYVPCLKCDYYKIDFYYNGSVERSHTSLGTSPLCPNHCRLKIDYEFEI